MTTSAFEIAVSRGYPYVCTDKGRVKGDVWFTCHAKTYERNAPYLYLGFDHKAGRWIIETDGETNDDK